MVVRARLHNWRLCTAKNNIESRPVIVWAQKFARKNAYLREAPNSLDALSDAIAWLQISSALL